MKRRGILLFCLALLAARVIAAARDGETYTSFFIDDGGRLHLRMASGREVLAPKWKDQVGFDFPAISSDGKTVGWMALYPFPRVGKQDYDAGPIAASVVLYRGGHILHSLGAEQTVWDWHFWRDGSTVAYSDGPLHGGGSQVVLCDAASGNVLARWIPSDAKPPDWAEDLRY